MTSPSNDSIHRLFFIVEGNNNNYPNSSSAKVYLISNDPSTVKLQEQFVSSPIFPLAEEGYNEMPILEDGTLITFAMVPSIIPAYYELANKFESHAALWFTLGLANLVIIENSRNKGITQEILNYLSSINNITAYETWTLEKNNYVSKTSGPSINILSCDAKVVDCDLKLSDELPLNLKFSVSEYIISVNKFLTASKKFTPSYYSRHLRTIEVTKYIIADLSFLHGDFAFTPTSALLNSLKAKSKDEAISIIQNKTINVENLINDKHWMIVQFNSSLSYIYSQAYAGTFPLFDHFGIVRRHSFLGLGTAIGSLFELIIQLELAFFNLPFEDIAASSYLKELIPADYKNIIFDPAEFTSALWRDDVVKQNVIGGELLLKNQKTIPDNYYNRLSFFSGRLGFKEYEFSATAAIQVVVEANSLPWHIINYTHEIIHNHVRTLLNQLILVQESARESDFETWVNRYRDIIKHIVKNHQKTEDNLDITYHEYFIAILLKFIINVNSYGSLSVPSNISEIKKMEAEPHKRISYILPYANTLRDGIRYYYKDITEIFVHVIDFSYVYKQQLDIYLTSVWTSWSTVSAVINDLTQYVSRSLVVVGLTVDGTSNNRYEKVKSTFRTIISTMTNKNDSIVLKYVIQILDNEDHDKDLRFRFYNCIIVGDLVYNFFVGKLQSFLDADDENVVPPGDFTESGIPVNYYINTNSFEGGAVLSKVRFLFDQLGREIFKEDEKVADDYLERTSAWLLLLLSSNDEKK